MVTFRLFVDGEFVDSASGETFGTCNPATGEKVADVALGGREDAEAAVAAARKAFDEGAWPRLSGAARAAKLRRISELIDANSAELALLEARDGGGTIRKAELADVPVASAAFDWFARMAKDQPSRLDLPGSTSPESQNYLLFEPYGVVAGIIPWNFPLHMAAFKIAPAIAAGNTCVIKPATLTPATALRLAELIAEADLPPGVVNVVPGPGPAVGEELVRNLKIDKVAFTGSTDVGRQVMQQAAGSVKALTLELGGKSANIVLEDADLDQAAAAVLWGTFWHGGQLCLSGTRALVQRSVYDEFLSLLISRVSRIVLGDQLDRSTDLGPLIAKRQVDVVERYVALGREEVGEPVAGGRRPEGLAPGLDADAFYLPTIFANVDNSARIAQEEIFGPVLSVIPFTTDEEAVAIANDSLYGLGGGVQSGSTKRAEAVAARMRTGTVWINDYHMLDVSRPFGGYKESGVGVELGTYGFDAYRLIKHVHINPESRGRQNHEHYSVLSARI